MNLSLAIILSGNGAALKDKRKWKTKQCLLMVLAVVLRAKNQKIDLHWYCYCWPAGIIVAIVLCLKSTTKEAEAEEVEGKTVKCLFCMLLGIFVLCCVLWSTFRSAAEGFLFPHSIALLPFCFCC